MSDTCRKYERGQQTWPSLTHTADSITITERALQKTKACCILQRKAYLCIQALPQVEMSSIGFQLDLAEGNDKPKPSLVSQLVPGPGKPILILNLAH